MGEAKAFLDIAGRPLIKRIIDVIKPLFNDLLIVVNEAQFEKAQNWGIRVVTDVIPDKGSLGGIYSALHYADTPAVFCFACDMPFLNEGLINYMKKKSSGFDLFIPKYNDRLHPLHAVYCQRCRPHIEDQIKRDELKISKFFSQVHSGYLASAEIAKLDSSGHALFNINTPADLVKARQIAKLRRA